MVSQPIKRSKIWISLFIGQGISQVLSFLIATGIPLLIFTPIPIAISMLWVGSMLSLVFIAIAFLASALTRDKSKGIGLSIILWLFFALLFDGLILFLLFQFADYPIENAMIGIMMFSPVDMSRILILLQLDVSALLGYTGAVFSNFFGTFMGTIISIIVLIIWSFLPFYLSLKIFNKKDL